MSGLVMSTSTSGLFTWFAKPFPVTAKSYLKRNHSCCYHTAAPRQGPAAKGDNAAAWQCHHTAAGPADTLSPMPSPPCALLHLPSLQAEQHVKLNTVLLQQGKGNLLPSLTREDLGSTIIMAYNSVHQLAAGNRANQPAGMPSCPMPSEMTLLGKQL